MTYGITSNQSFNPSQIEDDRNAFDKLDWDGLTAIFRHNGIEYKANARKDALRMQLMGLVAAGKQINIPVPGGGSAPMSPKVHDQIAPKPVSVHREAPPPPPAAPAGIVDELTGGVVPTYTAPPDDPILTRVNELKDMRFFALKAAAKKVGITPEKGLSAIEKDELCKRIAEAELGH